MVVSATSARHKKEEHREHLGHGVHLFDIHFKRGIADVFTARQQKPFRHLQLCQRLFAVGKLLLCIVQLGLAVGKLLLCLLQLGLAVRHFGLCLLKLFLCQLHLKLGQRGRHGEGRFA